MVWNGSPAYHIRYPLLALLFFALIFVIDLGPIGEAIGTASVLLWILFLILSFVAVVVDKSRKYYLTNRRVISHKTSLLVPDLANVRSEQSILGRLRGVGNVYFDSKGGQWIVFRHVKDPEQIAQSGSSLIGTTAAMSTISRICNYCGAKVPAGVAKCPACGADR
jgi:hypothetical protein